MLRIDVTTTPRSVAVVITACLLLLWLYGLFRRLNWLRWVTVGLAILGILLLPRVLARIQERGPILFQLFKYALFDTGTLLLCLPAAREWFSSKAA
jgi:4-hydroxybenzoate polyprenyltransferase